MKRKPSATGISTSAREDQREPALVMVLRRQHPLHHVLVGAVRGHGGEDGAEQRGPDGVFVAEDAADVGEIDALRDVESMPSKPVENLEIVAAGSEPCAPAQPPTPNQSETSA